MRNKSENILQLKNMLMSEIGMKNFFKQFILFLIILYYTN